jgi:hypothetical protein
VILLVFILDTLFLEHRFNLGILLASPEASIKELQRSSELPKEKGRSSSLIVDNLLSQNPDSSWGHFLEGQS